MWCEFAGCLGHWRGQGGEGQDVVCFSSHVCLEFFCPNGVTKCEKISFGVWKYRIEFWIFVWQQKKNSVEQFDVVYSTDIKVWSKEGGSGLPVAFDSSLILIDKKMVNMVRFGVCFLVYALIKRKGFLPRGWMRRLSTGKWFEALWIILFFVFYVSDLVAFKAIYIDYTKNKRGKIEFANKFFDEFRLLSICNGFQSHTSNSIAHTQTTPATHTCIPFTKQK